MDYLLHHLFISSHKKSPQKQAVVDETDSMTYSQLSCKAGALAKELTTAGVKPGDRIAFFLDHNIEQSAAILAISSVGGAFVPINSLLFPQQVSHILRDSGAKVLITTQERNAQIKKEVQEISSLKTVLHAEKLNGSVELERTCNAIENDLAAILYTSGSSGQPKGVMLSHKNLIAGCWIISDYLNLSEKDRLLGVLPLSFDYGLNQLITMLAQGGTYFFKNFKFPNEIVSALKEHKITGLAGIPPIWALLIRSSLGQTQLPHLRYVSNSGGAVPTKMLSHLRESIPDSEIVLMYGLTEAFRSTYLPFDMLDQYPTSMGKAIPNTEILVVNENGELCGPNQEGELVHRGPTVALGYWNQPEVTAQRYKDWPLEGNDGLPKEKVVFSGDIVYYDDDGILYFVGRRDGMIKCSGNRISPTEIEEVVFKTGLVKEVAAIGIEDFAAGQVVKVFVVPIESKPQDQHAKLIDDIIDYCASNMPGYMVPRKVEILETMPKTAVGKTDYPKLKQEYN